MNAHVDIGIRSEDVDHGFVVDQFFNDEGREIKADHVGLLHQVPEWRDLIVDIELVGMGEGFQTFQDLLFEFIFIGGFDQMLLNELHGDGIGESRRIFSDIIDGHPAGLLLTGFDSGQNAGFAVAGSEHFRHGDHLLLMDWS
ncbi:hypothetical protein DESC_260076 [Desulfosarcina cetonica]|nr:hypothetical protein DESC_260076 [Desulfosarcina cetonica]